MDVEKTIEFLLEQQAAQQVRFDARMEALTAKVSDIAENVVNVQHQLRRAVRLSVEEARTERVRRRALDQKVDARFSELAAAQAVTEKTLQRFIDSLQQSRNGHDQHGH